MAKKEGRKTDPSLELKKTIHALRSIGSDNWINKSSLIEASRSPKLLGIQDKPDLSSQELYVGAAIETGDVVDENLEPIGDTEEEAPEPAPEAPDIPDEPEVQSEQSVQPYAEPDAPPEQSLPSIPDLPQSMEPTQADATPPEPSAQNEPQVEPQADEPQDQPPEYSIPQDMPVPTSDEISEPVDAAIPPEPADFSIPESPETYEATQSDIPEPDTQPEAIQDQAQTENPPEIPDEVMTEFPVDTTPEPPRSFDDILFPSSEPQSEADSTPKDEETAIRESIDQQAEEASDQEFENDFQHTINTSHPDETVGGFHLDEKIADQIDLAAEQAVNETVHPEPSQEITDLNKDLSSASEIDSPSTDVDPDIAEELDSPATQGDEERRAARVEEYKKRQAYWDQYNQNEELQNNPPQDYFDSNKDFSDYQQNNSHEAVMGQIEQFNSIATEAIQRLSMNLIQNTIKIKHIMHLLDRMDS